MCIAFTVSFIPNNIQRLSFVITSILQLNKLRLTEVKYPGFLNWVKIWALPNFRNILG